RAGVVECVDGKDGVERAVVFGGHVQKAAEPAGDGGSCAMLFPAAAARIGQGDRQHVRMVGAQPRGEAAGSAAKVHRPPSTGYVFGEPSGGGRRETVTDGVVSVVALRE